jgi:hypothetical protein
MPGAPGETGAGEALVRCGRGGEEGLALDPGVVPKRLGFG